MPYPPPPPGPDVGEFQAIGLLPAPQLPDVTGNAGKFLETDGVIPQWEPVSGVLPDQAGHSGEFLTTDGATASWATVTGALPDQTGHNGEFLTTDGASASWAALPLNVSILQYGAVPNDNTNDISDAYYAALNYILTTAPTNPFFDYQTQLQHVGSIYIPQGSYYTSRPLMIPSNVEVFGDGPYLTYINAGVGTAATPSIVQGFSGPVFYASGMVSPADLASYTATVVSFGSPLNGTSSRSLHLTPTMFNIPLHDSYPWSWFLGMMLDSTKFCLRFEYKIPTSPPLQAAETPIFGTAGPPLVWADGHTDRALGIRLYTDGADYFIRAYVTTCPDWTVGTFDMTTGVRHVLTSNAIAINATVNVELDYDGSAIWLYIDGVHQTHVSATGPIFRQPWEGAMIGSSGMELTQEESPDGQPTAAFLGCIDLANTNRHTGTGSFSPAIGPYTADANTLWLCNWNQTDFPLDPTSFRHLPFLEALTAIPTFATNGPDSAPMSSPNLVKHYMRMSSGQPQLQYSSLRNLHIYSQTTTAGLNCFRSASFTGVELASSYACKAGFKSTDGNSFYSNLYKCYAYAPSDYGFQWYGNVSEPFTLGAPIGVQVVAGGIVTSHFCQPNFAQFITTLVGPGNSSQSLFVVTQANNDSEGWSFLRQMAPLGLYAVSGSLETSSCIFAANNSNGAPAQVIGGMSGTFTSTGDSWQPGVPGNSGFGGTTFSGSPCLFIYNPFNAVPDGSSATIINPTGSWNTTSNAYIQSLPPSNFQGTVTLVQPGGQSNQRTLSTSDLVGHNVAGEFTIMTGYDWGNAQFTIPEPDANYDVIVSYKGYVGSAPAAGSTIPGPISLVTTDGFFMTTGVDPGGTSLLTFSYIVVRNSGGPLFSEYAVTIPDTLANPLLPKYTNFVPWAIGVTVVPVGVKSFHYDGTQVAETIFSLGTTTGDSHWLDITFLAANSDININFAGVAGGVTSRIQYSPVTFLPDPGPRSKFLSMWHPGSHNIMACAITPTYGEVYVDGRMVTAFVPITSPLWGGFLPDIYLGQLWDGSNLLTRATLRNLKIDIDPQKCITLEQDTGPGLMTRNMFIGDEWTQGYGSTSASGGWATQCADGKYGTDYYWFLSANAVTVLPISGFNGIVTDYWSYWGQYQDPLNAAVVLAGWHDLLADRGTPPTTGSTAAATWAGLLQILEGNQAAQSFTPPTANTFAIALFATNQDPWGGGVTATVAGVTFSVPYLGSEAASFTSLANAMNADGTVGPLVTASYVPVSGGFGVVEIVAKAPGTAGNGIPVSAGGGAFWYTGFPAANATFAGVDCVLDINGVTFVANFDTDAATSTNNLVALITASVDPLISGVVTAANVANKCVVTAVVAGLAGNLITTTSNRLHGAYLGTSPTDPLGGTLVDGLNGLLNRCPNIIMCTLPPFGVANSFYTVGKEAERQTFNTSVRNWVIAHAGAGAVLADVDAAVKDGPGTSLNAIYDNGAGYLNDAGQTVVYALVNPLLP